MSTRPQLTHNRIPQTIKRLHLEQRLPRPLHDRVLVRRIEEPEKGLIITPDIAKQKPLKAEVLAVGPGRCIDDEFYATQVKPGQIVLMSPNINMNWPDIVEGSGVLMIQENDILGVIE